MDLIWIGLVFGLSAGLSPGPLLTLVITASLERGPAAGLRVAVAPVITDLPIILLAVSVLRTLSQPVLVLTGALGGGLVVYLGIRTLRSRPSPAGPDLDASTAAQDLWKGALVNLLNPHPWIFWITVLGPLLLAGWRRNPLTGIAFLVAFYTTIVGSKMAIAWLVGTGRHILDEKWYRRTLTTCGLLLVGLGCILLAQAANRLI